MKLTEKEKKRRQSAIIWAVSVHALILLSLITLPRCSEGGLTQRDVPGVQVALGFSDMGGPENPIEETVEDPQEEVEEVVEETANPNEGTTDDVVSDVDSDVDTDAGDTDLGSDSDTDSGVEDPKDTDVPDDQTNTDNTDTKSDGDDSDDPNDKGKEDGVDTSSVYDGNQGGGDNDALSLAGWDFDDKPDTPPQIRKNGYISLSFSVNEDGEIENIQVVSSSYSATENEFLKDEFRSSTFMRIEEGAPSPLTTGTYYWKINGK